MLEAAQKSLLNTKPIMVEIDKNMMSKPTFLRKKSKSFFFERVKDVPSAGIGLKVKKLFNTDKSNVSEKHARRKSYDPTAGTQMRTALVKMKEEETINESGRPEEPSSPRDPNKPRGILSKPAGSKKKGVVGAKIVLTQEEEEKAQTAKPKLKRRGTIHIPSDYWEQQAKIMSTGGKSDDEIEMMKQKIVFNKLGPKSDETDENELRNDELGGSDTSGSLRSSASQPVTTTIITTGSPTKESIGVVSSSAPVSKSLISSSSSTLTHSAGASRAKKRHSISLDIQTKNPTSNSNNNINNNNITSTGGTTTIMSGGQVVSSPRSSPNPSSEFKKKGMINSSPSKSVSLSPRDKVIKRDEFISPNKSYNNTTTTNFSSSSNDSISSSSSQPSFSSPSLNHSSPGSFSINSDRKLKHSTSEPNSKSPSDRSLINSSKSNSSPSTVGILSSPRGRITTTTTTTTAQEDKSRTAPTNAATEGDVVTYLDMSNLASLSPDSPPLSERKKKQKTPLNIPAMPRWLKPKSKNSHHEEDTEEQQQQHASQPNNVNQTTDESKRSPLPVRHVVRPQIKRSATTGNYLNPRQESPPLSPSHHQHESTSSSSSSSLSTIRSSQSAKVKPLPKTSSSTSSTPPPTMGSNSSSNTSNIVSVNVNPTGISVKPNVSSVTPTKLHNKSPSITIKMNLASNTNSNEAAASGGGGGGGGGDEKQSPKDDKGDGRKLVRSLSLHSMEQEQQAEVEPVIVTDRPSSVRRKTVT
eukprot:TRINITY_DN287_c2_g1_i5.p1 TRINITY_DN287_c2_g1~~TRINITY_DN287_c2_g1_i5.p1  ORF type:complete len:752 (+),score=278.16 TRINITY_DN287_c2_g1_i5:3135-5390(+)